MGTCQKSHFCQLAGGGRDASQHSGCWGGHIRDGHFVCGSSSATLWPTAIPAVAGICVCGDGGRVGTGGGWEQVSHEIVPCDLHKLLPCAKQNLCIKCSPSTFNSYFLQSRVPLSMSGSAAQWKPAGETQPPQLLVVQSLNRGHLSFFHLKNGGGKNGACSWHIKCTE